MPKTHYIGRTKSGAIVARASQSDYGYTHAATFSGHPAGKLVALSDATFSKSAAGALTNWGARADGEIVELKVVSAAEYRETTGKGAKAKAPGKAAEAPPAPAVTKAPAKAASPKARPPRQRVTPAEPRVNKGEVIITLLRQEIGANLAELVQATGWQKHSVRGFLAGTLKAKGYAAERRPRPDGSMAYFIIDLPAGDAPDPEALAEQG